MSPHSPSSGRLAAGKQPFWRRSRPARQATLSETGVPDPQEERTSVATVALVAVKGVATIALLTLVLAVLGALVLALTVMAAPRVGGDVWIVKWAAWPRAQAPAGALAMTTSPGVDGSMTSRLALLADSGDTSQIVTVLAGPGGKVATGSDGLVYLDGVSTGLTATTAIPAQGLGERYLAVCRAGACALGTAVLVPTEEIVGQARGIYTFPASVAPADTVLTPLEQAITAAGGTAEPALTDAADEIGAAARDGEPSSTAPITDPPIAPSAPVEP